MARKKCNRIGRGRLLNVAGRRQIATHKGHEQELIQKPVIDIAAVEGYKINIPLLPRRTLSTFQGSANPI